MVPRYVLPLLAVVGLAYAIFSVVEARKASPTSLPIVVPPTRPSSVRAIAGAGLIEARLENIPIGATIPGVVVEVFVKIGDRVKKGQPLFRLDDREYQAECKVREAALAASKAQLRKLEAAPRQEDLPPLRAAVEEARAHLADAEAAAGRSERLYAKQMVPASDYDKDRFTVSGARAALAKAEADLRKMEAGTWKEDLEIARVSVLQAESLVEQVRSTLDRLVVRSLADGEILQVNVRPGQYAALVWKEPLIILGDLQRLHVRVDIDENDLPLFDKKAEAIATLKGRPQVRFNLELYKIEPYVIPKKSLTGDNSERVDTRVLQVVYELPDPHPDFLYVGQQMDVYIRAARPRADLPLEPDAQRRLPFEEPYTPPKSRTPAS
ncbi:efflux RND transporter periplasmic adaptor subunit [Isosphaeraceae bacterium EP7]